MVDKKTSKKSHRAVATNAEEIYDKAVSRILFAVSEAAPYIRTGGLGDVAGALPKALHALGYDIRVILPLYEAIPESFKSKFVKIKDINVPLGWRNQTASVYEHITEWGGRCYFIENEYYFKRKGLYGHYDDAERYAFFSKAVLETMPVTGFYPDIIHLNDWQTALVSVFLDEFYRDINGYQNIKTVFTIHNIQFQGIYDKFLIGDLLGLKDSSIVLYDDCLNFMKGGIEASKAVTTVSKTYSEEILNPLYSYGLESILWARSYKIKGIVNGIDTDIFNPSTDKALFSNYDRAFYLNKQLNKQGLASMLGLNYEPNKPMIAMVTRLTAQKGLDLVAKAIEDILTADVQFVLLGTGDLNYETMFKEIENRKGAKMRAIISFSDDLASKIYAAADIFLMPSRFEPCGLGQLIAMRYGAIPVVRETGGLKDTVEQYNFNTKKGTGFLFKRYDAEDMLRSLWSAVDTFYNRKEDWEAVVANAMDKDYGWSSSAKEYDKLYRGI